MSKIVTLGIDLAKNIFQLHGVDGQGKVVLKKRLSRSKLIEVMSNLPPCLVGMEACGGAHYWARLFREMGHRVKLMAPQYVKPYVKTNKNDDVDAEGCCEAVGRPNMRYVSIKTTQQQDMQSLHRMRNLLVKQCTQLSNQIRGLLLEYGIEMAQGKKAFKQLVSLLDKHKDKISPQFAENIAAMYEVYKHTEAQAKSYEQKLKDYSKTDAISLQLQQIPGLGPMSATALVAGIGSGEEFKNGRQVAAWLGLVPKQNSSGHKIRLQGISKRGNRQLRTLLIHGARSVVRAVAGKTDGYSLWIKQLLLTKSVNQVCVAVANKNARIVWAMMKSGADFDPEKATGLVGTEQLTLDSAVTGQA